MSARKLARHTGISAHYAALLRNGARTTCSAGLAQRIADALGVPRRTLFLTMPSTGTRIKINQGLSS